MTHGRMWYIRRGTAVRGPFQAALIKRYLLLGRVKPTDELSLDRQSWLAVTAYPAFAPDHATSGGIAAVADSVRAHEDERKPGDRRQTGEGAAHPDRRGGAERRAEEPPEVVERRLRRARVLASLRPGRHSDKIPALIAVVLLAGIIVSGFLFSSKAPQSEPLCDARPAPGVNWSNCRKEQTDYTSVDLRNAIIRNARFTGARLVRVNLVNADLAYTDLVGADLSYAQLAGARATGANLRKADLSNANLKGADLSYADLTGAVLGGASLEGVSLGNAIWTDGKICALGSLGACLNR